MAEIIPVIPTSFAASACADSCASAALTDNPGSSSCPCESVWTCMRGRTRLCCELQNDGEGRCQLTLLRNSRTYGKYEFTARESALSFAARLRVTFEGNGWTAAG